MRNLGERFWHDEAGNAAIEYGLITAIIGVGIIVSLTSLSGSISSLFGLVGDYIPE